MFVHHTWPHFGNSPVQSSAPSPCVVHAHRVWCTFIMCGARSPCVVHVRVGARSPCVVHVHHVWCTFILCGARSPCVVLTNHNLYDMHYHVTLLGPKRSSYHKAWFLDPGKQSFEFHREKNKNRVKIFSPAWCFLAQE